MTVSQKIENQLTSTPSNTTLGHIRKGCSIILQGYLFNYVHSNIICNRQNLEITQMLLNKRMDKESVAHLHVRVLLSNLKEKDILKFALK